MTPRQWIPLAVCLVLGFALGFLVKKCEQCPELKQDPTVVHHEENAKDWRAKFDSLKAENDRIISAIKPTPQRINDATKTLTDKPLIDGFERGVELHGADIND